jgi:hypothetical protein
VDTNRKRALSPLLFALVFLLFAMPFFSVSCSGTKIDTFTGYEIATGNTKIDMSGLGAGTSSTPSEGAPKGSSTGQIILILALLAAAAGAALPFLPIKVNDPLLISTILGGVGVVLLVVFAVMAPGEVSSQSAQFTKGLGELGGSSGAGISIKGDLEMGVWLSLLAFAGAGGLSFFLRSQGVDASAPLNFQQIISGTPGAGAVAAAPYAAPYSAPYAPAPPAPPVAPAGPACSNCGTATAPGDTFCKSCGTPVGGPGASS